MGQGVWGALLVGNLKTNPAIPWCAPVMAIVLWLFWQYLGGKGWPRSTSKARHSYLRANRVPGIVLTWALVAGVLSIVSLAGLWIVLFQLVKMSPNFLDDFSNYPALTAALVIVMASLVSPVTEEAAFRGYCQSILEREFTGTTAILISTIFFTAAHVVHGLVWPKLLVYFLVGVVFGVTAYLTKSTLPALPVHIIGDVTFFVGVWPHDAARKFVWDTGSDPWFWIHLAQTVTFAALAILSFLKLSKVSESLLQVPSTN
ncbi:MAG: CPBP family intramembrane metalloprotease [Acidobacteriia bacterium]|nr:CPBP family intramembrane metalloprotease [Terriglobia bacterium]